MTPRVKFSRLIWVGSALSMLAAWGLPARAAETNLIQLWQADWTLPNAVSPPGAPPLVGQAEGEGSGSLDISAAVPAGSLSGSMALSFDTAAGLLRSGTHVSATLQCCTGAYAYGDFNFSSLNVVLLDDQLTVAHDGFGFMKIMVRTTGSLAHTANIVEPPFGYSGISLVNQVYARVSVAGGDSVSFRERIESDLLGIFDSTFSASETRSVAQMLEVIVPWEDGLPVDFEFAYQEDMLLAVSGLDAERVELSGDNSFGHTMALFADVYDDQGNLLQGVLSSAQGIGYQSLAAVPEPASWMLMAMGLLGLAGWRRRGRGPAARPASQSH